MSYKQIYEDWCNNTIFDDKTKKELLKIKDNEKEIEDRFYKELEFGTAGLRGIMGAGTNRMNKYTVGKATQGLANFIKKNNKKDNKVVIAYDSRNNSKEFSEIVALCLNANGIKTYIFENITPVPELSYAVRKLECIAGIMITASHNPPKYNGYKVYWKDGAQIVPPIDEGITNEVNSIINYSEIQNIDKIKAIEEGLYNIIGKQIDDSYIEEVKKQLYNEKIIKRQSDVSIVYTPLHGTGNVPVQRILKEIGFKNINIVKEQEEPDGNFPTVEYPNPEDKKAFKLALELAKKVNAELVLATDPDADRLGVFVKNNSEYIALTGNMSALLILEYILSQKKERNIIPKNAIVIKSIVSSTMAEEISKEYGIKIEEVLTGFKYIGEKIKEFEKTNQYEFIFGYEESYGCLAGTHARDKDAITAVAILCEAAAYYKEKGISLWNQMLEIYKKYGFYKEGIKQITLEGIDGLNKIKEILEDLRSNPPKEIANYKVKRIRDYENQTIIDLRTNKIVNIELPKSNVLYYELENNAWVAVRPSGTEPKIKYYIGVKEKSLDLADKKLKEIQDSI
ncbi:MAG: phospho-sugar mutase [Clostridiaceae bacterium]|nr:phospho-sugar mutase [Clostridiaceae bacterium]